MFSAASKTNKVISSAPPTPTDPYIGNVALLMHGDGTSGQTNRIAVDSGIYNLTGTLTGNATMGSFGPYGTTWSHYFAGGNYILGSGAVDTDIGTSDFTMEFWFITMSATTAGTIFEFQDFGPCLQLNASGQLLYCQSPGTLIFSSNTTLTVGVWYHIAVTRASGTSTIWINGNSVASASDSTNFNTMGKIVVGGSAQAGMFASNCRLSDVSLYNSSFTPSTSPLTELSSTKVIACHKKSHVFTKGGVDYLLNGLTGPPIINAYSPFGETYNASTHGASLQCDGTGDSMTIPYYGLAQLGSSDFTIECWYYGYGTIGGGIFSQRPNSSSAYAPIDLRITGNSIQLLVSLAGTSWNINTTSTSNPLLISRYSWLHIALTRSGTAVKVFVNGVLIINATLSGSLWDNGEPITIGARANDISSPINGFLSDFRMVKGTNIYPTSATSTTNGAKIFNPPTAPLSVTTETICLFNFKNAGLIDQRKLRNYELVGNTYLVTSNYKFGTASVNFDNSSGTLSYARSLAHPAYVFGVSQDFTLECWIYPTWDNGGTKTIFNIASAFGLKFTSTQVIAYTSTSTARATATYTIPFSQWTHIAVCRSGGTTWKIYINGVATGTPGSYSSNMAGTGIFIASHSTPDINTCFTGQIDDLRFTNGVARYTTNFTVPTAPYPDQ